MQNSKIQPKRTQGVYCCVPFSTSCARLFGTDVFPHDTKTFPDRTNKRCSLGGDDHRMESYTKLADDFRREAFEIAQAPIQNLPYISCYENLYHEEEILTRAFAMEQEAREIRQKFQDIIHGSLMLPDTAM